MNSSDHKRQVAENLTLVLDVIGLPDAEIARSLGISKSKLGNWKRADNYPDPYIMSLLCDRYGVTMDWIYRRRVYGMPAELADKLLASGTGAKGNPRTPAIAGGKAS